MKVMMVHNFYRSSSPSGEDAVYRNEASLLRSHNVEVVAYERHNDEIDGPLNKVSAAAGMVWSANSRRQLAGLIRKEKPDIAHFHNIWYLITPSAYSACKDAGIPVVQTLHNFRMFCTNGLMLRNGTTCQECIGKYPWRSVPHACYMNSMIYSVPIAVAQGIHRAMNTWMNNIDAFIALTGFGKKKFVESGIPEDRIYVKPNFLPDPPVFSSVDGDYAVFLGRLSAEKGLETLIDALALCARTDDAPTLKIIGDGPLRQEIGKKIEGMKLEARIECTGRKSHSECMELLSRADFLVMPALCLENFPLAIIEAFACGKPVIASRLGAMEALVEDGKTGLLFEPGNPRDLADKIEWLIRNRDAGIEMGKSARREFEAKYKAERNYEMLMTIYREVMNEKKSGNGENRE